MCAVEDWCGDNAKVDDTYSKAGTSGINVASDKTIIGVGNKGIIKGKGLRFVNVKNIIIQNIHITNLNPQYVWGGDAFTFSGTSKIWVDHYVSAWSSALRLWPRQEHWYHPLQNHIDGRAQWSAGCDGYHYWTIEMVGQGDQITLQNNLIEHTAGRGPALSATTFLHAVSNVWRDINGHAIKGDTAGKGLFEGNVFQNVKQVVVPDFKGQLNSCPDNAAASATQQYLGRVCQGNIFILSDSTSDNIVYPTHMIDNVSVLKFLVMAWTMRFNDVLNADKLYESLSELLTIGDWKKLGGRLRHGHNKRGALEVHVPTTYTNERSAVSYSHQHYDISIEEHNSSKLLPKASSRPSNFPGASGPRDFGISPGAPASLKDYTSRDVPMIGLHIITFQDATLVTITWPHVLFDAVGFSHLIQAWSAVLAGHKERVPNIIGGEDDVLYDLGDISQAGPQYAASEARILSGIAFILFVIRMLWIILTQPTVESRIICLPKDVVDKLHQRALQDIKEENSGHDDPWVSPSDAILAWLTRALVDPSKAPRPISMTTPIDARTRLSHLQNADGVYVQNMILGSFVNIVPNDFRGPLGKQALVSRQGLLQQLDESNLIGILQLFRKRWDVGKTRAPIFAAPGSQLLVTNNRLKIDLFTAADFGPAVIQASKDQQRKNHPGRPVHHYASSLNPGITMRNFINIHTRDLEGNYWLSGFFTPRKWSRIEEGFKELQ
ncbi:pectin lyase C [Fusarium mundagurra]|uniref:pectin lyase n=1 Tax=Fusarium mundagurra TaxID=1567541 RepID=A0A8H5Z5C0_9HYPO|nr:pectin lyase C [Fusarium mundagurra]